MTNNQSILSLMKKHLIHLPIGVMSTLLGFLTLANVYALFNLNVLKHVVNNVGVLIILIGFLKFFIYPKKVAEEMTQTIGASIYPTFSMSIMLMGSYYVAYNYYLGKTIWLIGVLLDLIILIVFIYQNIVRKFDFKAFIPSTFVPFVGLIVATISSGPMQSQQIATAIFYFSFIAYFVMLPFLTYRLFKYPVGEKVYPLVCIMAAPPSLCLMAYLNLFEAPNLNLAWFVYVIICIFVIYMYAQFPKIFKLPFVPSFAGLTFPTAISTLASFRMSAVLEHANFMKASYIVKQIGGVELLICSACMCFVTYKFLEMFFSIFTSKSN